MTLTPSCGHVTRKAQICEDPVGKARGKEGDVRDVGGDSSHTTSSSSGGVDTGVWWGLWGAGGDGLHGLLEEVAMTL